MPVKRSLPVLALVLAALAVAAAPAAAKELSLLDAKPTSPGNVVTDAAGNAYIAWNSDVGTGTDAVIFCKVPAGGSTCSTRLNLPLPPPAPSAFPEPSGAFPILGPGSVVYVVAPRYNSNDLAIWKSENGGASFGVPIRNPTGYSNKTDPTDVLLSGSNFVVGSHNPGLGVSVGATTGGTGESISEFKTEGTGGVAGSSLTQDQSGNAITAYWNISDPPYPVLFYRYDGSGEIKSESNWVGPTKVSNGYEPRLAGGPAGVFLASQDYPDAGGPYPTVLHVRKFDGTNFGAPTTLVTDAETDLFDGGSIDESADGSHVAVAWPGRRAGDAARVMRLYMSASAGAGFGGEVDIGSVGDGYAIGDNAAVAVANGGSGWATFRDATGLHLLDFSPIAGTVIPKPADYKGKTKVADKKTVGGYSLILRLPKACVQSQQRFFAGVGARKRRALAKKLGGRVQLKQVVFVYDGKKLQVKKKKPFRYLIDPGVMAAGSTHVVKAKVTVTLTKKGTSKKVKRTLKGTIKSC